MKEIIYKGKKVKVPFEDANYNLDGEKDVGVNYLEVIAVTFHLLIIGLNMSNIFHF